MEHSILNDVKKLLGIDIFYDAFDIDIITHINSVLMILNQMGIGNEGFTICSQEANWCDFLKEGEQQKLSAVKSYVALKVRTLFDPPTSSVMAEALNANLKELEWRIYITENF